LRTDDEVVECGGLRETLPLRVRPIELPEELEAESDQEDQHGISDPVDSEVVWGSGFSRRDPAAVQIALKPI
jgi:hypothetical protein